MQLTSPNRIPFLLTNKVDLIVATFGITPERAKQVMFSIPYSAIENVVFAPKDKHITTIQDLKGLRVGVPRGTVQDVILSKTLGSAVKIARFDDDPSTYEALLAGQVDAIAETGLTGDEFYAKHPEGNIERKFTLLQQPNGITHAQGPVQPAPVGQHVRLFRQEQRRAGCDPREVVQQAAAEPAGVLSRVLRRAA